MTKGVIVSKEMQELIFKLKEERNSQRKISSKTGIPKTTIQQILKRGIVKESIDTSRRRVSKKIDPETSRRIITYLKRNPDSTLVQIINGFNLEVSKMTVSNFLAENG